MVTQFSAKSGPAGPAAGADDAGDAGDRAGDTDDGGEDMPEQAATARMTASAPPAAASTGWRGPGRLPLTVFTARSA
jgi:hypothetical protein